MGITRATAILDAALSRLAEHAEVLRDLDAAVGDGDLGITVAAGAAAVRQQLEDAPPVTVPDLLRTTAAAFARANPSTMAALVGAGLLAAAKEVEGEEWSAPVAERVGRAAAARIAERGKAELGDKTVLDALVPSVEALAGVQDGAFLPAMIAAARSGVEGTSGRAGRRGRAAWVGERGIGHPDPGASAYLLFLESVLAATDVDPVPSTGAG